MSLKTALIKFVIYKASHKNTPKFIGKPKKLILKYNGCMIDGFANTCIILDNNGILKVKKSLRYFGDHSETSFNEEESKQSKVNPDILYKIADKMRKKHKYEVNCGVFDSGSWSLTIFNRFNIPYYYSGVDYDDELRELSPLLKELFKTGNNLISINYKTFERRCEEGDKTIYETD